ncbi:MAG: hypothetical protein ACREJM_07355 [Candidatus Saccharimonadales bacterium]
MNKKLPLIRAGLVILVLVGGGAYYLGKNNNSSNNSPSNNTTTATATKMTSQKQGNAEIEAVLSKVKDNTPTVTATRVVTEQTDDNNLLGKANEYQYAGSFYDTRTKSDETTSDNYGTASGGTIEIFANTADSKARGEYLAQFQTGAIQAGAYRVVGVNVLRVSENYTAIEQKQMLDLMQSAL